MDEELIARIRAAQFWGAVLGFIVMALCGGSLRTNVKIDYPAKQECRSETFNESIMAHHFLFGLVNTHSTDVNQLLYKRMQSGDALLDVSVTTRISVVDSLCSAFTLFLYTPNTIDIEGHIQRSPSK